MLTSLILALIATTLLIIAVYSNLQRQRTVQANHKLAMARYAQRNDLESGSVFVSKDGKEIVVLTHSMIYSQYGSHKTGMAPENLKNAGYVFVGAY